MSATVFPWAAIAALLVSTCAELANDEPDRALDTYLHHESNSFIAPDLQARIVLRATRTRETGSDRRWANDGTETNIVWTIVTVQVLVENDRDLDDKNAIVFLENLRARLRRSRVLEAFDSVGASIVNVGDSTFSQASHEGRELDVLAFDLELSCVLNDTDVTTAGNWVEKITLSGQIQGGVTPLAFGATPDSEVEIS